MGPIGHNFLNGCHGNKKGFQLQGKKKLKHKLCCNGSVLRKLNGSQCHTKKCRRDSGGTIFFKAFLRLERKKNHEKKIHLPQNIQPAQICMSFASTQKKIWKIKFNKHKTMSRDPGGLTVPLTRAITVTSTVKSLTRVISPQWF